MLLIGNDQRALGSNVNINKIIKSLADLENVVFSKFVESCDGYDSKPSLDIIFTITLISTVRWKITITSTSDVPSNEDT